MPLSEQQKALEYRRMMQSREDYKALRERAMAGDPAALLALRQSMAGALPWQGWDPVRKVAGDEA